jgi:large subunit ribosomal protein L27
LYNPCCSGFDKDGLGCYYLKELEKLTFLIYLKNMAKTKAKSATRTGRDSQPKYLGIKLFAGEEARPGMVIVKQRGTKFQAGKNVKRGSDDTLYALKKGSVQFQTKKIKTFNDTKRTIKIVHVEP